MATGREYEAKKIRQTEKHSKAGKWLSLRKMERSKSLPTRKRKRLWNEPDFRSKLDKQNVGL